MEQTTVVELRVPPSSLLPPPSLFPPPLVSQCEAHGPPIGVGREKNADHEHIVEDEDMVVL